MSSRSKPGNQPYICSAYGRRRGTPFCLFFRNRGLTRVLFFLLTPARSREEAPSSCRILGPRNPPQDLEGQTPTETSFIRSRMNISSGLEDQEATAREIEGATGG